MELNEIMVKCGSFRLPEPPVLPRRYLIQSQISTATIKIGTASRTRSITAPASIRNSPNGSPNSHPIVALLSHSAPSTGASFFSSRSASAR